MRSKTIVSFPLLSNFPALSGLRVLAVDDNADHLELVKIILEEYSVEVTTVAEPAEALDAIARLKPDVLISDIVMPNEDGYSLIRKVRNLPPEKGGAIPAIALTAFTTEEEHILALKAGFSMYISKPIEPNFLVAVVASLVIAN